MTRKTNSGKEFTVNGMNIEDYFHTKRGGVEMETIKDKREQKGKRALRDTSNIPQVAIKLV